MTVSDMAGAEDGPSLRISYAVTDDDIASVIVPRINKVAQGLVDAISKISTMGQAIKSISGSFGNVLAAFDPKHWNLAGYEPQEKKALVEFGNAMAAAIRRQGCSQERRKSPRLQSSRCRI